MLREAQRVRSAMLIANAWHARSDAASSLVVALGIIGSLAGVRLLDPIAAAIVGFMVARMGWMFGWDALQDLSDRALDDAAAGDVRKLLMSTPGCATCTNCARARWATSRSSTRISWSIR
jgi:divalent metal cation (Fe/Co/Zn/Cd) transporter